jgi:hypothetical protein
MDYETFRLHDNAIVVSDELHEGGLAEATLVPVSSYYKYREGTRSPYIIATSMVEPNRRSH